MIVLVPVSRFRVPYETARGRPYSQLERLVLEAVADTGATLGELRRTFRVHERLLVEAVVTLVAAGWVAVAGGPQARFVLTAVGHAAVGEGRDPVSVIVTAARPQTVVMERVTGQVARHGDARSWRRDDLGDAWQSAAVMTERITRNSLDEAQVQKLLPRDSGHWVRRIGPIRLVSRGSHFVAVEVDPLTGSTRGLPAAWDEALAPRTVECARARLERLGMGPTDPAGTSPSSRGRRRRFGGVLDARTSTNRSTSLRLGSADVVVGQQEHDEVLSHAFGRANSSIAVVSPTVGGEGDFRRVVELAVPAVTRGVRVDFLVGEASDALTAQDLVAIANQHGYRADPRQGRALLRARSATTGSGASLLVYDDDDGALTVILGDHAWLGGNTRARPTVGLTLREPSLTADVARAVASLWTGRGQVDAITAGSAERWRRLASNAEEQAALAQAGGGTQINPDGDTTAELIVDDEHAGLAPEGAAFVHVGSYRPDADAGDGASRGITLRLAGPGVAVVRTARARS